MLAEAQQAFRRGGWRGGTRWPDRMVPNIAGIVRDLERGATTLKKRRMQGRPSLVDTGRLRGSMTMKIDEERGSVEVGTNVRYARDHQLGNRVTLPGASIANPVIRENLRRLLKKEPQLRSNLGWLFQKDNWTLKLQKRPIIEPTRPVLKRVREIVAEGRLFPGEDE